MDPLVKKALSCIDLVGLSNIVIDDVIDAAISKAVAESENKIDDAAVALILPIVKVEVKKFIAAKVAELNA